MEENRKDFVLGIAITLGTIVVGLISYILYIENISNLKEPTRCEYNGWAYADQEIYDSIDGCNICFCHTGKTICSENDCNTPKFCDDGTLCPVETPL